MDFNEFNPEKVLIGAGDMVHGRGIYTAKNKQTARVYKNTPKVRGGIVIPVRSSQFPLLTFVLVFDTLRSPDVSGLASDEATLAPVACGGRSDCRELSSFLILF